MPGITGATVEGLVLQDYFYNLPMLLARTELQPLKLVAS